MLIKKISARDIKGEEPSKDKISFNAKIKD